MSPGKSAFTESIHENEWCSVSLAVHRFPKYRECGSTLRRWRFYHEFAIGRRFAAASAGRRLPFASPRQRWPDLAAAFRPLSRSARRVCMKSLPTPSRLPVYCENEHSRFALKMRREGIRRRCWRRCPTVRCALCLAVALLVRARRRFWRSMNRRTACIATCCRAGPADYRGLALQPDLADQPLGGAGGAHRRRAPVSAMRWRIAAVRPDCRVKPVIPDGGAGVRRGSASCGRQQTVVAA